MRLVVLGLLPTCVRKCMHIAELEVHTTQIEVVCLQAKLPLRLKPLTVPFAGAFACQV